MAAQPLNNFQYLPRNEMGRITAVSKSEPLLIFDQTLLPFRAVRTGGASVFQHFQRWGKPPIKIHTGRKLYTLTLSGTYSAEHWGGASPFAELRDAHHIGLPMHINMERKRIGSIPPTPFLTELSQITCTSITETPQPTSYIFNTPILTDWSIVLEEDAQ